MRYLIPILYIPCLISLSQSDSKLRVASFNLWNCGTNVENGFEKILKHIRLIDPHILGVQEVTDQACYGSILDGLGTDWSGVLHARQAGEAIFTKFGIVHQSQTQTSTAVGCQIEAPQGLKLTVFSIKLQSTAYGPLAACSRLHTSDQQLADVETARLFGGKGRVGEVEELLANNMFAKATKRFDEEPLLLVGDFGSPSPADYIPGTAEKHCGSVFEWPAVSLILGRITMVDAFRYIHRDPALIPGNTWPTIVYGADTGVPSPRDRIDFVFFHGYKLVPASAEIYQGKETLREKPNHTSNDWPSDHAAVVAQFNATS